MNWYINQSMDDDQYWNALKNHNYTVWSIYYDHQIESINKQINELNQQIKQINTMSLTATAAISPYQRTTNSLLASNDLLSLCMAQQMNGIIKGYSSGMQKNQSEIKQIQQKLKDVEDRKRSLIRKNRNIIENKQIWQQSQVTQHLQYQTQLQQHQYQQSHNNNNNNNNIHQNMVNMQNKIKQIEDMMLNVQSHIIGNNDNEDDDEDDDENKDDIKEVSEKEKVCEWIEDIVKLPQYYHVLIENGFEDIESICDITTDDLIKINITKLGHQKKIIKEVFKLSQ